jgi:hypothetical protein
VRCRRSRGGRHAVLVQSLARRLDARKEKEKVMRSKSWVLRSSAGIIFALTGQNGRPAWVQAHRPEEPLLRRRPMQDLP